jgi:hypothetical protein
MTIREMLEILDGQGIILTDLELVEEVVQEWGHTLRSKVDFTVAQSRKQRRENNTPNYRFRPGGGDGKRIDRRT